MSKNQINDRLWCDEILCSFVILCANFCVELSALCRILKTLQRHISARLAAGWIQRTNAPSGRCCLAGHSVLELWGINYFNVWLFVSNNYGKEWTRLCTWISRIDNFLFYISEEYFLRNFLHSTIYILIYSETIMFIWNYLL